MSELQLPPINALICMHNQQLSTPVFQYMSRFGARKVTIADSQMQVDYALKHDQYDFFLIEQNLPGISGIDLFEYLSICEKITDNTESMLCLDRPTQANVIRAKELGVRSIMIPPFSIKKIGTRLQKIYSDEQPAQQKHFPAKPPLTRANGSAKRHVTVN